MGRGAGRAPGASLAQLSQISKVQSSPRSTVTQLAVHNYDYDYNYDYNYDVYIKSTLHTAMTLLPVTIICFEI